MLDDLKDVELEMDSLLAAANNGCFECVKLLVPVSDVDGARLRLKENGLPGLGCLDAVLQEEALKGRYVSDGLAKNPRSGGL